MKRKFITPIVAIFAFLLFTSESCEHESADRLQAIKTEQVMKEMNKSVGMPNISNFTMKNQLKEIYEACDDAGLLRYAYVYNEFSGEMLYLGECMGYGIPYSTQFSNPERQVYNHSTSLTLPQPEPDGLFKPEGLSATWLLLKNPATGEFEPQYIEPTILVLSFKISGKKSILYN